MASFKYNIQYLLMMNQTSKMVLKTGNKMMLNPYLYMNKRLFNSSTVLLNNDKKSFISAFVESVDRQWKENKQLQDNVKQISAAHTDFQESDAIKAAKKVANKTSENTQKVIKTVKSVANVVVENPVVQGTGKVIYKTGEKVAEVSHKVADPVLDTKAAKAVGKGITFIKSEVIDSADSAYYAEYKPYEVRKKEREIRDEKLLQEATKNGKLLSSNNQNVKENENAGTAVELHKSSRLQNTWRKFKEENSVMQKLFSVRKGFDESDHPWAERIRDFINSPIFQESEQSQVISMIKTVDPNFKKEIFLKEMTKYTIPDLLEAHLKGDIMFLKDWCSERVMARFNMEFKNLQQNGLISDCKLLDIRGVDIHKMVLIEDEFPLIIISLQADEVLLFRDLKGNLKIGKENKIDRATYSLAFTKSQLIDPSIEFNPKTNNWIVFEWSRMAM